MDVLAGQEIAIEQRRSAGYGYGLYLGEYDLLDETGASVDLLTARHDSGVSDDTEFMWSCFTAYFSTHAFWEACGL